MHRIVVLSSNRRPASAHDALHPEGDCVTAGSAHARRILGAAALFHLVIAVLLCIAARSHLAPGVIRDNGVINAIGLDGHEYAANAARLTATLRAGGIASWAHTPALPHERALSLTFLVLAPVFGFTTLAAEPLNLACYLLIVMLAYAITRELASPRAATAAAAVVGCWPSLLLHTTQFLKDPLFIAGALLLVFLVLTWLTRNYDRAAAARAAAVMLCAIVLLLLIRSKFAIVVVAIAGFGLLLLIVTMAAERRMRVWNLVCAIATLMIGVLMLGASMRGMSRTKQFPAVVRGESKTAQSGVNVPTVITWRERGGFVDEAAVALGSKREQFNLSNQLGASGIDDAVEIRSTSDVMRYLPRAAAIGLWAPFPRMWLQRGRAVGSGGRLVSAAETLAMYAFELLALCAVVIPPRRVPAALLLLVATFGVTMLALVVSNVGTLYRFRYSFWIVFIAGGIAGLEKLRAACVARRTAMT
jgi:hypothetical protein